MIQQHKTNASSPKLLIESHRHTSYHHRLLYLILLMNTLPTTTTTTTCIYLPTHQPTNQPTNLPLLPFLLLAHPFLRPALPPSIPPTPRHPRTHTTPLPTLPLPLQANNAAIISYQIKSNQKDTPIHQLASSQNKKRKKEKLESEVGCLHAHTHTHTHTHTRKRTHARARVGGRYCSPSSRGKQVDSTRPLGGAYHYHFLFLLWTSIPRGCERYYYL